MGMPCTARACETLQDVLNTEGRNTGCFGRSTPPPFLGALKKNGSLASTKLSHACDTVAARTAVSRQAHDKRLIRE